MSPTRTRTALTSLVAATVLLGGALSGCSLSRDDDPPDTPVAETTPLPTPTEDETPAETPTPTETVTATPTTSPSAAPAPTLSDALLSAAELPQLNDTTKWSEGRTGSVQPQPFGLCAKFDLLSIGAVEAIDRKFTARGDSAGQQVADFPDAQNALRAAKVVEAWHKTCAQRVRGRNVNVRPITDVAVKNGRGSWYLVSYERQGDGHFHSLGMVLDGPRMTLLRMDHDGQDHNYEPGQDPMELAVQAASAKLGGS